MKNFTDEDEEFKAF